jgi:glucose/arabinose dehydrogenase
LFAGVVALSLATLFLSQTACGEAAGPEHEEEPVDSMPPGTVPPDTVPPDTVPPDTVPPDTVPAGQLAVEVVASGLEVPWALAFAPDGRIFFTERPGRIRVIEAGTLRAAPLATLDVARRSETGLMGIALAPDFATSGNLYVVATVQPSDGLETRVLRYTARNGTLSGPQVLISGLPANNVHAGGAVAFGPDGMLYITAGDAQNPSQAQDAGSLRGKILRYTPAGGIPGDNPIPGSPVYALGVRNSQGLAWHPVRRDLFATDHGPSGGSNEGGRSGHDELNVIRKGGNYGWPVVIGFENDRFIPPIAVWTPAIAPNGVAFYTGTAIPEWKNNVFVGGLRGQQLRRLVVEEASGTPAGWRVTAQEPLFEGEYGRIRLVAMGPDGNLYFGTSNRDGRGSPGPMDDRILRIGNRK